MRLIPQLLSAPLNPIPIVEILEGATYNLSAVTDKVYE